MINTQHIIEYLSTRVTDPVPSFIMQKEIVKAPATSPCYIEAYNAMKQSKWYRELADEQWDDGSWGRFHSQDSKALKKQRFTTTETALRRARELGLGKDDPLVAICITLMERYVRGEETWTDNIEKHHDGGKSHLQSRPFLTAANISLFDPDNPVVIPKREVFVKTLTIALAEGVFKEDAWEQENRRYSGPCLNGWNAYPLMILQSANGLEDTLQRLYLDYIWHRKDGIYYLTDFPLAQNIKLEDKRFNAWLSALGIVSGFSLFPEFMQEEALPHLLQEVNRLMNDEVAVPVTGVHYAESWRDKEKRKTDVILRIVRIMVKC